MSDAIRVRLPESLLTRLDDLESELRGRGHRKATRSAIIRAALTRYLNDAEATLTKAAR